jgi:hypothetical protein
VNFLRKCWNFLFFTRLTYRPLNKGYLKKGKISPSNWTSESFFIDFMNNKGIKTNNNKLLKSCIKIWRGFPQINPLFSKWAKFMLRCSLKRNNSSTLSIFCIIWAKFFAKLTFRYPLNSIKNRWKIKNN